MNDPPDTNAKSALALGFGGECGRPAVAVAKGSQNRLSTRGTHAQIGPSSFRCRSRLSVGQPHSAEPCQEVDMYTQLGLYIDGEWLNGDGRAGEDVINPANEKVLARLPHASPADLDRALAAAVKGFALWRDKSAHERGRIMKKAADLLRERAEHVARVLTQEQGKILGEARMEVLTTADIIEWYAEEGKRAYGRVVPGRIKGTRSSSSRSRSGSSPRSRRGIFRHSRPPARSAG